MQEVLRQERADGAEVHDVARPGVVEPCLGVDPDEGAVAPLGDVQYRLLRHVFHEPDAARAQDAPVRDVQHIGTEIFDRVEALGVDGTVPGGRAPFLEGEVLKLALPSLVAYRAIERGVDEQELQHTGPGALRCRGLRLDHHALRDLGGACDRELRLFLDLDEAHAAHARDRKARVIAVVRYEDPRLLGGFDDQRPFRHADWDVVDGEVDQFGAHATMTGLRRPAI